MYTKMDRMIRKKASKVHKCTYKIRKDLIAMCRHTRERKVIYILPKCTTFRKKTYLCGLGVKCVWMNIVRFCCNAAQQGGRKLFPLLLCKMEPDVLAASAPLPIVKSDIRRTEDANAVPRAEPTTRSRAPNALMPRMLGAF